MMLLINEKYHRLFIVMFFSAVFFPFIGSVHLFDWDELNFAEAAREMLVTGNYFSVQIDYEIFHEKPPLFFWLQALSFKIFGINEFAARFVNGVVGIITLLTVYSIGSKLRDKKFGLLWVFTMGGSLLTLMYYKTGIIDPLFNLFIFLSIYRLYKRLINQNNKQFNIVLVSVYLGLAFITKGPVSILIVSLCYLVARYILRKDTTYNWLRLPDFFIVASIVLLFCAFWLVPNFIKYGAQFFIDFVKYQIELFSKDVATHGQPFYYHFLVVLIGCFPLSVIGVKKLFNRELEDGFSKWMQILFWTVIILFSITTTKIIHYSSLSYLPLSYLATNAIYSGVFEQKWIKKTIITFGLIFVLILLVFYFILYENYIVLPLSINLSWILFIGFLLTMIAIIVISEKIENLPKMIISSLLFGVLINYSMAVIAPKVESQIQGGAVDIYKEFDGRNDLLTTVGFTSYGQFFYSKKSIENKIVGLDSWKIINEDYLPKDAYYVIKDTSNLSKLGNVDYIKSNKGYHLYKKLRSCDFFQLKDSVYIADFNVNNCNTQNIFYDSIANNYYKVYQNVEYTLNTKLYQSQSLNKLLIKIKSRGKKNEEFIYVSEINSNGLKNWKTKKVSFNKDYNWQWIDFEFKWIDKKLQKADKALYIWNKKKIEFEIDSIIITPIKNLH